MRDTYIVKPAETLAHDWLKRNIKGDVNNHIAEQNLQSKQQIYTGTLQNVLRFLQTTIKDSL